MDGKKYNGKAIVGVVLFLILFNCIVAIVSGGIKNLLINTVLYVIEIAGTIWIIVGSDIFKKTK